MFSKTRGEGSMQQTRPLFQSILRAVPPQIAIHRIVNFMLCEEKEVQQSCIEPDETIRCRRPNASPRSNRLESGALSREGVIDWLSRCRSGARTLRSDFRSEIGDRRWTRIDNRCGDEGVVVTELSSNSAISHAPCDRLGGRRRPTDSKLQGRRTRSAV